MKVFVAGASGHRGTNDMLGRRLRSAKANSRHAKPAERRDPD